MIMSGSHTATIIIMLPLYDEMLSVCDIIILNVALLVHDIVILGCDIILYFL